MAVKVNTSMFMMDGEFSEQGMAIVSGTAYFTISAEKYKVKGNYPLYITCDGVVIADGIFTYTECCQYIETLVNELM